MTHTQRPWAADPGYLLSRRLRSTFALSEYAKQVSGTRAGPYSDMPMVERYSSKWQLKKN